jgi:hypothetical protein
MTILRLDRKTSVRLPALSETTLLLMIAAGFFILHVLAIHLLQQSASVATASAHEASGAMFD